MMRSTSSVNAPPTSHRNGLRSCKKTVKALLKLNLLPPTPLPLLLRMEPNRKLPPLLPPPKRNRRKRRRKINQHPWKSRQTEKTSQKSPRLRRRSPRRTLPKNRPLLKPSPHPFNAFSFASQLFSRCTLFNSPKVVIARSLPIYYTLYLPSKYRFDRSLLQAFPLTTLHSSQPPYLKISPSDCRDPFPINASSKSLSPRSQQERSLPRYLVQCSFPRSIEFSFSFVYLLLHPY